MKTVSFVGPRLTQAELTKVAQCDTCHSLFPRASLDWTHKVPVLLDVDDDPDHFTFASYVNCPYEKCKSLGISDRILFKKRRDEC